MYRQGRKQWGHSTFSGIRKDVRNHVLPWREIIDDLDDAPEQFEAIQVRLGDRFGLSGLPFAVMRYATHIED